MKQAHEYGVNSQCQYSQAPHLHPPTLSLLRLISGSGLLARVGVSHSCIFCVTGRSTRCANRGRILLGPSVTHRCNKDRHRSPTSLRWPNEREIRRVGFAAALPSLDPKPTQTLRFVGFLLLLRQISRMSLKQYWASETVASQPSGILSDTAPKAVGSS